MIDPVTSLAFSMQSSPGTYALLLGSGISHPAGIPTGWDITLDLVKKLAAASGEECKPSPVEWYREKFGKEPGYSELLDNLVKAQTERQILLREYFEPSLEEKSQGVKLPTIAHRSIAALVAEGFIRVIITTNFDHLLETALREEGIEPTVISTPDQVKGALPLIHAKCCLLKVNGDYMDTRIRNTEEELASYEPEFDSLLDRILDEFGLVVCGWSAQWDGALRNALERTQTRRFSSYWIARGEIGSTAQGLISRRGMQIVKDRDADSFFSALQEQVRSLTEYSRPHPLSTEAAVISLKKYLSEQKYRIQLADLIDGEVEKVAGAIAGEKFPCKGAPEPSTATFTERLGLYEASCVTLLSMAVIGGLWLETSHLRNWQRALTKLSTWRVREGNDIWLHMQRYPGVLLFYALGISAVEAKRWAPLGNLFSYFLKNGFEAEPVSGLLSGWQLFNGENFSSYFGYPQKRITPVNDWLKKTLREYFKRTLIEDDHYDLSFTKFEILSALNYGYLKQTKNDEEIRYWVPSGTFVYESQATEEILREIKDSVVQNKEKPEYLNGNLFGKTVEESEEEIAKLRSFLFKVRPQLGVLC